jgi:hypothetical protein
MEQCVRFRRHGGPRPIRSTPCRRKHVRLDIGVRLPFASVVRGVLSWFSPWMGLRPQASGNDCHTLTLRHENVTAHTNTLYCRWPTASSSFLSLATSYVGNRYSTCRAITFG